MIAELLAGAAFLGTIVNATLIRRPATIEISSPVEGDLTAAQRAIMEIAQRTQLEVIAYRRGYVDGRDGKDAQVDLMGL